jgi:ligand-binding sensor domain-containing protein
MSIATHLHIMHKRRTLFFWLAIICMQPAWSQYEEKDFSHYSVRDGLSDNFITSLQQDAAGYLWIATDVGLNRFDGNSFTNFYRDSKTLPLLSNTIRTLKPFGENQLGIISRNGFQLLDTRDFSLRNYFVPDSTAFGIQRNSAWDAVAFPDQSFGVTTSSGFYVFDSSGKLNFRHDAYNVNDIGKKRILYGREFLTINAQEYLLYVEEKGLAYYHLKKKEFREINPLEKEWLVFNHPIAATDHWILKYQLNNHQYLFIPYLQDSIFFYDHTTKKKIASPLPFTTNRELSWESKIERLNDTVLAVNGGTYGFYLLHIDSVSGKITSTGKKLMPAYKITCLFLDRDKRLWVGTNEGLFQQKLNPQLMSAYRFTPAPGEKSTGGFNCVYRYQDKLYAGRFSLYKGLTIIDPVTMQVKKQIAFFGDNNGWNEILSMEMYHRDTLWIGTNAGLLWLDTKTDHYGKVLDEKKYSWAHGFLPILSPAGKDGYAWICSYLDGLVARYEIASRSFTVFTSGTKPALPFDEVKNSTYDAYGDVWIGGHSLTRWNSRLQLFDTVMTAYGGVNKFNDNILTLTADNSGSLWLHNAYNGLLEYRIKEKRFIPYSRKDGLPSDLFQAFSSVIDNKLWIESNNSLICFDTRTRKITTFDHNDGMPENKPTGRKIWFDPEDQIMYMCCTDYIVRFPFQVRSYNDNSTGLILQQLIVNNKKSFFQPGQQIKLQYNENNIYLGYTIIDFEKNNYQFSYKIDKGDDWNELGQQRNITLNGLSPGNYTVQVKAIGKSGNEKINKFTLIIQAPFWKTNWFVAACAILLATMLYYLYRYRIKQVRQKANIDKLLAQTEMKALHSQMNPHFIFNSLNSIREMILNNDNKEASHYLSKFAQLIRITLDQSGQSFISLRNTREYLERYIEMEKIRNSHFTWSIHIDKQLDMDETVLPPMLIQPFIENAIWHGVSGKNKHIHVNVDFKKENGGLVCVIEDDGVGIDQSLKNRENNPDLHNSFGIVNIRNRIRLLNEKHNLQSSISITDKKNVTGTTTTGTLVTLHLPLEINEE